MSGRAFSWLLLFARAKRSNSAGKGETFSNRQLSKEPGAKAKGNTTKTGPATGVADKRLQPRSGYRRLPGRRRKMKPAFSQLAAFQLRLGHPSQDVVVTSDVRHEVHGLATAGVAVAGLAEPLLLRKTRQDLRHVQPLVRVQTLGPGSAPCVFDVAVPDVVGGQGEAGAVGLDDAFRQALMHVQEVAGAALDALPRVEAVGHAHGLGGALGEHHQAAHAGLGAGAGLPVRFLIADRRQQAPVQTVLLGRVAEHLLVPW